jgi:hypothetical protein
MSLRVDEKYEKEFSGFTIFYFLFKKLRGIKVELGELCQFSDM